MDKRGLMTRIERAWSDLAASYAGLPDASLSEAGVTEAWSVKDLLAHVSTWEEEALTYLPLILRGERPPRYVRFGGIDGFNALKAAEKGSWTLAEVVKALAKTHGRLIALVETAPAAEIAGESRFRRRLRLDTYGHYPQHARAIREWRLSREV